MYELLLAGTFATIALIVRYYDRRAKERAILSAVTDRQRDDLNSMPPLSLVFFLTLATGLLLLGVEVGKQVKTIRAAQELLCARDCAKDDDCRPPAVCRRGACVDNAARPAIAMYIPNRNNLTSWSPINGH